MLAGFIGIFLGYWVYHPENWMDMLLLLCLKSAFHQEYAKEDAKEDSKEDIQKKYAVIQLTRMTI